MLGTQEFTRKRLAKAGPTMVWVLDTSSRAMMISQTTAWFGKILKNRRRQNRPIVSEGFATHVSTKPLSTKKNETPSPPALLAMKSYLFVTAALLNAPK
jgi:hypothetical protein